MVIPLRPVTGQSNVTLLLDAHDPVKRGGTGQAIDWTAAAHVAAWRPILLAGGLAPENVVAAITRVRPFGIDVSSGVEDAPGIKNHGRLRGALQGHSCHRHRQLRDRQQGAILTRAAISASSAGVSFPKRSSSQSKSSNAPISRHVMIRTFRRELARLLTHYVGRPTPVYEAARLTQAAGGATIFLKREDLTHTGAHKINNALGQAMLAQRMGKRRDRRGNRSGPARRGDGHGLCAARTALPCLHGRRGHGSSGAQRLSDAPAGRGGGPCRRRQPNAEGRDQRSDARLGDQCGRHLLPARIGARPPSVPADGSGVSIRHRPRSARADSSS